ncbi:MAG: hypothetical protein BGO70_15860 [Bacteroidetes bacterium 43-93]|nr:histidine kinase [Bacteroidota bacterium]OJX01246.1 MAG: hypothetical protein BGO70_15860 [Bacteroidetes bacterium 43-93]
MRWLLPLLVILVWAIHFGLLFFYTGMPPGISLIDSLISTLIMATFVWLMLLTLNSYPTRVGLTLYALLIGSFFSLASGYTTWFLFKTIPVKGYEGYDHWLYASMPIRYIANWLVFCWISTFAALQNEAEKIETKFLKQTDLTTMHREAELYKLRQQLQPHFLYNSLNSISALTMIAPEKAQEMISKLSDFLRSSVKREAQDLIPIQEELSYIEAYLSIESVRFGNRLKVIFDKGYTDDAMIPPFLLQPVLENAIKFGLYGTIGEVTIAVNIALTDAMLQISISNPYDSDSQIPRGTGFGLEGIARRLHLLYGRADLLETLKTTNTFTTKLKIPQAHV